MPNIDLENELLFVNKFILVVGNADDANDLHRYAGFKQMASRTKTSADRLVNNRKKQTEGDITGNRSSLSRCQGPRPAVQLHGKCPRKKVGIKYLEKKGENV